MGSHRPVMAVHTPFWRDQPSFETRFVHPSPRRSSQDAGERPAKIQRRDINKSPRQSISHPYTGTRSSSVSECSDSEGWSPSEEEIFISRAGMSSSAVPTPSPRSDTSQVLNGIRMTDHERNHLLGAIVENQKNPQTAEQRSLSPEELETEVWHLFYHFVDDMYGGGEDTNRSMRS